MSTRSPRGGRVLRTHTARPSRPGESLAAADRLLEQDGVIETHLSSANELVCEPPTEPLGQHGPYQSGAAYASSVLQCAPRLPEQVTVRVVINGQRFDEGANAEAETAFRDYCRFRADDALRQAATVRRSGSRQLRPALVIAAIVAATAAACGYLGESVDAKAATALLYVIGGIGVIAAWIIVWQPVEELLFGWRTPAQLAAVFELLSRARLEFIGMTRRSSAAAAGGPTEAEAPAIPAAAHSSRLAP